MFGREDLSQLLKNQSRPAVTILMPGIRAGQEAQQNPIRFDNLMTKARKQLLGHGLRDHDIEALLAPAVEVGAETGFWGRSDEGMAFFLAPGFFRWFALPVTMPELVRIGSVFHVTPMLPLVNHDGRFVLIAASARRIRFFDAGRHWIRERQGLDFPEGVEEIDRESEFEPEYHAAPQARPRANRPSGMPARQGTNDAEEQRHANLIEYLRRANAVLEKAMAGEQVPVVLAGQPNVQGHLRNIVRFKGLMAEGLSVNPDAIKPDELHARALPLVEPIWHADEDRARAKFASVRRDQGKASTTPEEILRAAREGRVEYLFVARDRALLGRYDADAGRLIVHGQSEGDGEDIADLAAHETLLHAGQVEVTTRERLPSGGIMAALLRY
jgi:hypothetical protein